LLAENEYPYLEKVKDTLSYKSLITQVYSYKRKCQNINKKSKPTILKDKNNTKEMNNNHLLLFQKGLEIYMGHLDKTKPYER